MGIIGAVVVLSFQANRFGPNVEFMETIDRPFEEFATQIERIGKFKFKREFTPTGSITFSLRNLPLEVVMEFGFRQIDARFEKRDGNYWIVPRRETTGEKVKPPFDSATLISGLRVFKSRFGFDYRTDVKYSSDKLVPWQTDLESDTPKNLFHLFLTQCGATYEIRKGIYYITDGFEITPRSQGGTGRERPGN